MFLNKRLFDKAKGIHGKFTTEEDCLTLQFEGVSPLIIDYDSQNRLPTVSARNLQSNPSINLYITSEINQILSPAKYYLLYWYYRFGHRNLRDVRLMLRDCSLESDKILAYSRVAYKEQPLCEIYQCTKARRTSVHKS